MINNPAKSFDLIPMLAQIAKADAPHLSDPLVAALQLSAGMPIRVFASEPIPLQIPNVSFSDDPEDADVSLIIHRANPTATAANVETQMGLGRRILLVDQSQAGHTAADPDLIPALLQSTVYVSNLAAYDLSLENALAVAMIPMRDGLAHRRYLATNMLYRWAWRSIVEGELRRAFGDTIPEERLPRAITAARSRLGAHLVKLRGRGLRYFIHEVGFERNRLDGMWFSLQAET